MASETSEILDVMPAPVSQVAVSSIHNIHARPKEIWVSGAGCVGCTVNGLYTRIDSLNGRPKYQQVR